MKMKPCRECNGSGLMPGMAPILVDPVVVDGEICGTPAILNTPCYVCEGTGTIPDEPVSHCQACGEPVELGLEWCQRHQPAADLWQALNQESDEDH